MLVEHSLAILNGIRNISNCVNVSSSVEAYFRQHFPQFYYFTSYHIAKGVLLHVMNFYLTFSWNFMDLFIIIISVGLATRLRQINSSMLSGQKIVSLNFSIYIITNFIEYFSRLLIKTFGKFIECTTNTSMICCLKLIS